MDYVTFCKNYFAVSRIPVNLINSRGVLYSSLGELLEIPAIIPVELYPNRFNPEFRYQNPNFIYGAVEIEETGDDIILGPAFSIPLNEDLVRQFMRDTHSPLESREAIAEALASIPPLTYPQFCQHLVFIHQCINHRHTSVMELMMQNNRSVLEKEEQHLEIISQNYEQKKLHNSYRSEQNLYEHIKNGNLEALKTSVTAGGLDLYEGKMAQTPLRQAKNVFISMVTKAGTLGAIPGGMDIERTCQLMDIYIQECEKLQSIDAVHALQTAMLLDFCRKTGESFIPQGLTSEIFSCINFIRSHVNMPIDVADVADHIHRSPSYTAKKFKEELGFTIGAFIMRCKLEEAKSLLAYSNKSLSEIAEYLCFSSQPHFQNQFKKHYNITPMKYRKES